MKLVNAFTLVAVMISLSETVFGAELELSFVDPAWNGSGIPEGQQCQRFKGVNPQSPELQIKNIPADATAIVLEFSDRTMKPMDNGGHGKVGYLIEAGASDVTIPRIPGHVAELQAPFFVVAEHRAPRWDTAGAYLPPCSGGRGNQYFIDVKAVILGDDKNVSEVLSEQSIAMAVY